MSDGRRQGNEFPRELWLAAVLLLTYIPTILWMYDRWFARDSYYSHGILVPFVTGFLIWQRRQELTKITAVSSPWGLPLIGAGLLLHILSSLFRVYFTSGFSMLVVITGLVLYLYGRQILQKIAFAVAFLVFMVPVPLVVIANISFKMKIFAAKIATVFLNQMGLWALRQGSVIKMQHTYVIVDDVCSGLRSLIALAALGSIFAYEMKAPAYKRVLLFLSTIPIAVATNVVRIIFLSGVSEIWGPEHATGFIHDFSGMLVFALAFVLLYAAGKLLE